jgi:hypothetical protein
MEFFYEPPEILKLEIQFETSALMSVGMEKGNKMRRKQARIYRLNRFSPPSLQQKMKLEGIDVKPFKIMG